MQKLLASPNSTDQSKQLSFDSVVIYQLLSFCLLLASNLMFYNAFLDTFLVRFPLLYL